MCIRDRAYKRVIVAQSQVMADAGGEVFTVDPDRISFVWPPAFSSGLSDEADAIATLVNAGALSQETALQLVENMSRKQAEEEAEGVDNDAQTRQDD